MVLRNVFAVAIAAFITSAAAAEPATYLIKTEQSPVGFLATGKPGFLKIKGEGAKLTGEAKIDDANKLTGTFDVNVDELKTGIDLRDSHMKEKYLETAKFPKARLVLDPTAVDIAAGSSDVPFTGKLTLKGVEKPVSGKLSVEKSGDAAAKGEASFEIKLSDFPIGVPSHLGVTVAEVVQVEIDFVADRQGPTVGQVK